MQSGYSLQNRKTIRVLVCGDGRGFKYDAHIGDIEIHMTAPNLARVFLPGHENGAVISWDWNVFPESISKFPMTVGALGKLMDGGGFDVTHADTFRAWLVSIKMRFLDSYITLIRVRSGGGHDSPLAGKVKIRLAGGKDVVRLVPVSQVHEVGGKLYIPLWLANEKAMGALAKEERLLPDELARALSNLEREFELRLAQMCAEAAPYQEAERIEAPKRAARREAERVEHLEAARVEALAAKEKAAEREKQQMQKEKKKTEKLRSLPIHAANVTVRGQDWSRRGGQYIKEEWIIEDATIKISGTRAYIFKQNEDQPLFFKPL